MKNNWQTTDRVYFRRQETQLDWKRCRIDMGRYTGEAQVNIRFRLSSDDSGIQDGWYIDDVSITDNTATVSVPFFDDMDIFKGFLDDNFPGFEGE